MEAWTTKGISAISSSVGKPMIMDNMTAYVCKNRVGKTEFARVLVEINADKGFKEKVELQYKDKQNQVKGTKTVRVAYDWKPDVCSHCVFFGPDYKNCKVQKPGRDEIARGKGPKPYQDQLRLNVTKEWSHEYRLTTLKDLELISEKRNRLLGLCDALEELLRFWASGIGRIQCAQCNRGLKKLLLVGIVIMDDFNVTLKVEEHSVGKSTISNDMQEFLDYVHNIGVEDLCMSGMFYTWIKSPSSPNTSIFKKLDRVMANDEFTSKFKNDHVVFYPFIVSDHSPTVLIIPKGMIKRKKSFKFANFIYEKVILFLLLLVFGKFRLMVSILLNWRWSLFPHDTEKKKIVVSIFEEFSEAVEDEEKWILWGVFFTNSLTGNKAEDMIKDVSDLEIKNAMFGISNSKAPGPDGYTACFFKKAWPIIGNDVCYAIKEFFMTGKILKEINYTLILILKTPNPKLVTEFRPIACCNVIYKCISKILTNRIKDSLNKLVNLNQSAFIQGRNIQDNILLTQELLKGYNRKGGSKRCALKIDIAKAYDTIHGYFCGGRGLRQGDPISPYLFTLVMEVFTLIMAHKTRSSTHFRDKNSISIIKEALEDFSIVSGLKPNLNKSTIFLGNVNNVGSLPAKYLGVPLVTKRLSRENLKDIERVLKGFLWCQGDLAKGKAKITWKTLCKPKCQGGLGFKDLGLWNEVLLTKHVWNIAAHKESLWVKWVLRDKAIKHIEIKFGDGKRTSVWYDKWNDVGPLSQVILKRDIYDARFENNATMSDMIENNQPSWPECQYAKEVWYDVKEKGYLKNFKSGWMDTVSYMVVGHGRNIKSVVSRIVFGAVIYYIWQERNKRCFTQEKRSVNELCDIMMDTIKLRLLSLKKVELESVCKMNLLGPLSTLSLEARMGVPKGVYSLSYYDACPSLPPGLFREAVASELVYEG
ncbi:RNA-directed DNA polymerase, eukaryota, reverse transcriptase zinc-binding domain protein [Tanacetum coccineum]